MMGQQNSERELFSYAVNLEKRVRSDHPLRRVAAAIDFEFVRKEVAHCYGVKGNESVDPAVILKMMFLLFFDDIASERELMKIIGERLDYLWFLGYGLDDTMPDHSVLSKARARWGKEVFERLFVRTVAQCVEAGLVDGSKLYVDASLVEANAAKESVIKGAPELIAALKRAYSATESKLEETSTPQSYQAVNDRMMSKSDPDAACVRKGSGESRPRYHHHRAVDDSKGVITALETTPGSIAENKKLMELVDQHEKNTAQAVQTVVADHKYGTSENYVACQERGIETHMGEATRNTANTGRKEGIFNDEAFTYDPLRNVYRCPAGAILKPRRVHAIRRTLEYKASARTCASCALRAQCTRSLHGRTVQRHEKEELLNCFLQVLASSPIALGSAASGLHSSYMLMHQVWQANTPGFSPSFAVFVRPDANSQGPIILDFTVRDDNTTHYDVNGLLVDNPKVIYSRQIEKNTSVVQNWYDMTIQLQPSYNGDGVAGQLAIWINSDPTVNAPEFVWYSDWGYKPESQGGVIGMSSNFDSRIGVYRRKQQRRFAVFFDEIKRGATAQSVN